LVSEWLFHLSHASLICRRVHSKQSRRFVPFHSFHRAVAIRTFAIWAGSPSGTKTGERRFGKQKNAGKEMLALTLEDWNLGFKIRD
jgi:hypothetical protein